MFEGLLSQGAVSFLYRDSKGEEKQHSVIRWSEVGHYLKGWCVCCNGVRTFRKDRVVEYLDGSDAQLIDPRPSAQPLISDTQREGRPAQIVFTGFPSVQRSVLEQRATDAGMDVRKSVTQGLDFLCGGPNAGPTKLEKARAQRVYIMTQAQFLALLETGELPDEEPEWF
ncbi:MAG: hypothetical protein HYV16_12115 [Gammaproteobacteria bacterium]|nr:hypothetical protein [Gammaproteobacteria bacterium]